MLIYFNQLRIKYLGYLRFTCFSVAAYAVLNFVSVPQLKGESSYYKQHQARARIYPHCSRSVRAIDVLPANSPRRAHDGNLSQLHAYLSCVWWSDGPDFAAHTDHRSLVFLDNSFPYYNSKCADAYQCVAIALTKEYDYFSDLVSGGYDNNDIPVIPYPVEYQCGLNIMDLIIRRRELGMTDICSAKLRDPIEILCRDYRYRNQKLSLEIRKKLWDPYPNPCLPAGEKYYRNTSQGRLNVR